jgi:hypothetical protein
MAALTLVILIVMASYAWLAGPMVGLATSVLRALWLLWLPLVLAVWLLANRDT